MVRRNVQWRLLLLLDPDDHLFQGPVVRNSFYSENLLYACAYTDPESHGNTEPYGNTYPHLNADPYSDSYGDPYCNPYLDANSNTSPNMYSRGTMCLYT